MTTSVAIVTVGCPKNSADSDFLASRLVAAGLEILDDPREADAIVVNTCGFIKAACEESLDTIMELASLGLGSRRLVVCGCLSERYGDALRRDLVEADAVFGLAERSADDIAAFLTGRPPGKSTERLKPSTAYAHVKISDGCDRTCSFCTIPAIRGPYRSRTAQQIEAEVKRLVDAGTKEIILVGQDTAWWGRDLKGRPTISSMLRDLARQYEVWFRLMYLQPDGVTDELIQTVAAFDNICSYFDVPFQHASERVLRRMRRTGDGEAFLRLIDRIRTRAPEAAIRTSLIVGFPGETDGDFELLADFLRRAQADYAGLFIYSAEQGTAAAALADPVDEDVALARHRMLADLADDVGWRRAASRIGARLDVLIEETVSEQDSCSEGRSQFQAPDVDGICLVRGAAEPGDLMRGRVEETDGYDMICGRV